MGWAAARCLMGHLLCLGGCKTPLFMDTYGGDYYILLYCKLYYPRTLEMIIAIIIQEMEIK